MSTNKEAREAAKQAINDLDEKLEALNQIAQGSEASELTRLKLDVKLRSFVGRAERLSRELDPIEWPRFVFDPGDPSVVGRFVALALIAQPRISLAAVKRFHGSGVYALYYNGNFAPYRPISGSETPIYVGKANPAQDTARNPLEQGDGVSRRLKDHLRSISKVSDSLNLEDFDCRFLVVQTGWQDAAEMFLIDFFKPIWNNETGICYGVGKHGDSPSTRSNKRSPWDTLHPGREWAWRDPDMMDSRDKGRIISDLQLHFSTSAVRRDVEQLFKLFLDELSQNELETAE